MNSELIESGNNWIILSPISQRLLQDTKQLFENIDSQDFKNFTSTEGTNSVQNYLTRPLWLDSEDDFFEPDGWIEVEKRYLDQIQKEIVNHRIPSDVPINLTTHSAWSVTGHEGSYHTAHFHQGSDLSAVIYTDIPDNQTFPDGSIFFILHSDGDIAFKNIPHKVLHLNPAEGMMIIFPSHVIHGVYPQKEGLRRTLNLDLNVKKD